MNNVTVGEYTLLAMPIAGIGGAKVPLPVAANGTDLSKGTSEDEVVKKLVERMKVIMRKGDGSGAIPSIEVPSLAIEIEGREIIHPASGDAFPIYGSITSWKVDPKSVLAE